jgi:hypothetical protein
MVKTFFKVGVKAEEKSEELEGDVLKIWRMIYYG